MDLRIPKYLEAKWFLYMTDTRKTQTSMDICIALHNVYMYCTVQYTYSICTW